MEIGIGLPTTIPWVQGPELLEWARRADRAGFSTLGTIDRIVYRNYEPLVALAAAAAVTERIRLTTAIVILPYRLNAGIVAKQVATIHHLSGGRFVFGVAVGGRPDDYEGTGAPFEGRGRRFEEIERVWAGEERGFAGAIGPDVSSAPPPIMIGGSVDAAFRRAARYGDGWMSGGSPPDQLPEAREKLQAAWREAGRDGEPRAMALTYFALGADPDADARRTLGDYYAFAGEYAEAIVSGAAKGEDAVRERVRAFEEVGCDELILFPTSTDPDQVNLLARVAL